MATKRKRHSLEFKAKVALEAIKGQRTVNEIAAQFGVHPSQIAAWKREVTTRLPELFASNRDRAEAETEALTAQLYQQIGQQKVELDWLKKRAGLIG